ncbi:MAG TPA: tetratricopeptide repeat protein [Verrucomicrobiae bacterium]
MRKLNPGPLGLLWLLGLLAPASALAHGDLHEQIAALTKEIQQAPTNAVLYLRRAELHRLHAEYDAALADIDRAGTLDPALDVLDLARGKTFSDANWPLSARSALDRFLARSTNHIDALHTRARVLVKLGEREAAARDYTRAIEFSREPQLELYIERANALTTETGEHLGEALRGLEDGIRKIGPIVTLELFAIDLEVKQKRYDAALTRLDQISAQFPRKETWLARRGEILQQAGRDKEARDAFRAALKAISILPAPRRQVPAMLELEKRLQALLEQPAPAATKK